ncbi:neuropeptide CCHamide-1 receptor [Culicoides brevitarsis]|uniref:neuropeptide CCHamide-1 receptor n=1 Tax=Culicoides brevitarsis TaxID=469753 RepID=UPI00307C4E2A
MKTNESEIIDGATSIITTAVDYALSNLSSSTQNNNFSVTTAFPNASNEEFVPYKYRPETYLVPILFSIIFIVGVLGNGTLIIVFIKHRTMRNVPNTYILSLAVADLLVVLFNVPLVAVVYAIDSWPWGQTICSASEFIKDLSVGVSVFTLTALSADRFFAIVDPLRKFHTQSGGKRATRVTIAIALSIWVLAILCGMPSLIASKIKELEFKNVTFYICYPYPEEWGNEYRKTMVLTRLVVYFVAPLLVIAIFYALMAHHLIRSARDMPGEMHGAVRQVKARRKVAVTVLAFVVIFGICFLPMHIFFLWFYFYPDAENAYNSFWHVFRIVGFCLSFINSCANPVALYCVSGAFRKHFNR